ncbi:hypothetical protein B296_00027525 [Ensete ventricosum]|uniref:Retrotransposon gag domain-containing protein n=1 Tax=Ensete ventricosum TaxID=4639 RepID=A0A426YF43_ENSVE|nr:hypothetical protein B296_00027525 [Ensete ventricosum]
MKEGHRESSLSSSPFIPEIQDRPILQHFRLPMLEAYDGGSDPMEHVVTFRAQMALYGSSHSIMCRALPMTLCGIARGWYSRLPPTSIRSFDQLVREFEANFLASARLKPTTASLLGMRQKEDEPLGPYLARFTKEIRVIPDAHPSLVIQAFMIGIRPSHFFWFLMECPRATVLETLQRASQYLVAEAQVAKKHEDHKRPTPQGPNPLRIWPEEHDRGCYCRFHRDYDHDTKCYNLKNQIEDLIRHSHLGRYVRKPYEPSPRPKGPVERQINAIVGGPTVGRDNSLARKAYA